MAEIIDIKNDNGETCYPITTADAVLFENGMNVKTRFELEHPVNSLYLTIGNEDPAEMFGGTWEKLPENYALWTASSGAGNKISAGLPNITGRFHAAAYNNDQVSGVFYRNGTEANVNLGTSGNSRINKYYIDASRVSSIYGASDTVQPPAYTIYAWLRTA